jgi:dihydrofolate reductase
MNVVLIAAISADGKIAEREGQTSLDWTSKEDTKFFVLKTKEIGVVVMGRKTFETIGKPLKDRRTIVMTRSPLLTKEGLGVVGVVAGVAYTDESPEELVSRLNGEGVQSLALAGGASVYSQFLQAGLVSELYLTVEPVLFGTGVPLASGFERLEMELVDVTRLGEQAVLLHYRIP